MIYELLYNPYHIFWCYTTPPPKKKKNEIWKNCWDLNCERPFSWGFPALWKRTTISWNLVLMELLAKYIHIYLLIAYCVWRWSNSRFPLLVLVLFEFVLCWLILYWMGEIFYHLYFSVLSVGLNILVIISTIMWILCGLQVVLYIWIHTLWSLYVDVFFLYFFFINALTCYQYVGFQTYNVAPLLNDFPSSTVLLYSLLLHIPHYCRDCLCDAMTSLRWTVTVGLWHCSDWTFACLPSLYVISWQLFEILCSCLILQFWWSYFLIDILIIHVSPLSLYLFSEWFLKYKTKRYWCEHTNFLFVLVSSTSTHISTDTNRDAYSNFFTTKE